MSVSPAPATDALEAQKKAWDSVQTEMQQRCTVADDADSTWGSPAEGFPGLRHVGGIDISFAKDNDVDAAVTFVVLAFPSLAVVHEETAMVKLEQPYIPGYLAFREVPHLVAIVEAARRRAPELMPQVIMVDGNGILHPRMFGAASQLGVELDTPTIGVAKNFLQVDGLDMRELKKTLTPEVLPAAGSLYPIVGVSGTRYGHAVRTSDKAVNPVFVSPGHRCSIETASAVAAATSKVRVPEPVRQADFLSREHLRKQGML